MASSCLKGSCGAINRRSQAMPTQHKQICLQDVLPSCETALSLFLLRVLGSLLRVSGNGTLSREPDTLSRKHQDFFRLKEGPAVVVACVMSAWHVLPGTVGIPALSHTEVNASKVTTIFPLTQVSCAPIHRRSCAESIGTCMWQLHMFDCLLVHCYCCAVTPCCCAY